MFLHSKVCGLNRTSHCTMYCVWRNLLTSSENNTTSETYTGQGRKQTGDQDFERQLGRPDKKLLWAFSTVDILTCPRRESTGVTLLSSSVSDSRKKSQHAQYLDTETEASKWNSAVIHSNLLLWHVEMSAMKKAYWYISCKFSIQDYLLLCSCCVTAHWVIQDNTMAGCKVSLQNQLGW